MRRVLLLEVWLCAVTLLGGAFPLMAAPNPAPQARLSALYGKLPLSFEANAGQVDGAVKFLSRCQGHTLSLTATEAVLRFGPHETTELRLQLEGGNRHPQVVGTDPQETISNYLVGNDPAKWHTAVRHYGSVRYEAVYPGVDLVYRGNQHQLEYDFVVAPGADPRVIRLAFTGADAIAIGPQGELTLHTAHGDLVQPAPAVYQESGEGRERIDGRYVLLQPTDRKGAVGLQREVGFALGHYHRNLPLIIDPVLIYKINDGSDSRDTAFAIAVDASGNAYIAGFNVTESPAVAFVDKMNATGTAIVYRTVLSGNGDVVASGIAVDGAGNAYVAGYTDSTTFPGVNGNSAQPTNAGGNDGFVTKINPAGTAPVYSTFLGGSGDDFANAIAVDATGLAYVAGGTHSTDFPVTGGALGPTYGGGSEDAFVTVIKKDGTAFVYSTFLGGSGRDTAVGIAVGSGGTIYVTGLTNSINFPGVTSSSLQPVYGGGPEDAFVTAIKADGTAFVYSTFLGGSGDDSAAGIAIDGAANAYITGATTSRDFPVTATAIQPIFGNKPVGTEDAFLTEINATGTASVYSTFLAGNSDDWGTGVAVDAAGNAYVAGYTLSSTFTGVTGRSIQPTSNTDGYTAFFTEINAGDNAPVYSTFLGNGFNDEAWAIAADSAGDAYLAGSATLPAGTEFPFTASVTKIGPVSPCANSDGTLCLGPVTIPQAGAASQGRFRVVVSGASSVAGGFGHAVPLTESAGYFWLGNSALADVLVRVQPCGSSGFEFLAAGVSTLGTRIAVLDTETGATATYLSASGSLTHPVADRVTFGCSNAREVEGLAAPSASGLPATDSAEEAVPAANQSRTISFSPSNPTATQQVTFFGQPAPPSGVSRIWRFSDDPPGITHLEVNGLMIHQFGTAGLFTVTFEDASQVGASAPVMTDVVVSAGNNGVQVSVTGPTTTTTNTTVSFQAAATNCEPGAKSWTWLVDGAVLVGESVGPSIQISWPTSGRKRVTASNLGCGTASGSEAVKVTQPPSGAASCRPGPAEMCLDNGRFQISAVWTKPDGSHGQADVVGLSGVEGSLSLGSGGPDVLVRVSSSCASAHAYAVLAGGFSTVKVDLTVKDEKTGKTKTYRTKQGALFASVNDESFFRTCP